MSSGPWEIVSENGKYRWLLQNDGNAVVYRVADGKVISATGQDMDPIDEPPPLPGPKPWEDVTEAQLRKWRGAIATTLWNGPCGVRPNQPDNPIFTAMYDNPDYTGDDRARMLREYPYTHWAMGPLIQGGYHGGWSPTNFMSQPQTFLDRVEEVWMAGKIPALFLLDDTGVYSDGGRINREAVERDLTPLYSQPRFQALARIVVLAWEPDFLSDDWQWGVQWMARVFPKALRYIHFTSGHGAPGRGSELAPNGPYNTEGEMWVPVAPYIHGFLQQDTYSFLGATHEGRTPEEQVLYDAWDFIRRFRDGYAGWPTAGADGKPIDMVMFEYGSYALFGGGPGRFGTFANASAASVDMGRQLLGVDGIAGYGDGGPV